MSSSIWIFCLEKVSLRNDSKAASCRGEDPTYVYTHQDEKRVSLLTSPYGYAINLVSIIGGPLKLYAVMWGNENSRMLIVRFLVQTVTVTQVYFHILRFINLLNWDYFFSSSENLRHIQENNEITTYYWMIGNVKKRVESLFLTYKEVKAIVNSYICLVIYD